MYSVNLINNDGNVYIHTHLAGGAKLASGKHNWSILNKLDTFDFSLGPDNPGFGRIEPFKSRIEVVNAQTKEMVFYGRVLPDGRSMERDGMVKESHKAVDFADVLHDSYQRDKKYYDRPQNIVRDILARHNELMADAPEKQFKNYHFADSLKTEKITLTTEQLELANIELAIGDKATIKSSADYFNYFYHGDNLAIAEFAKERTNRVTAVDLSHGCYQVAYNGVVIGWINLIDIYETKATVAQTETTSTVIEPLRIEFETKYSTSTFDALMGLVDVVGGEFYTRYKDGINYFEITDQIGSFSDTPIRLGKNIMSMDIKQAYDQAYSRIVPIGKMIIGGE